MAQPATKVWDRTLGGQDSDYARVVEATTDGGSLIGGSSYSGVSGDKAQPNNNGDFWVVKLDANGQKQWSRTYGGNDNEGLTSLQQTRDGGYLLGGTTGSLPPSGDVSEVGRGGSDYWIIKLDANGNKQWDRRLGGNDHDRLQALTQTADGGYIVGGSSFSGASGDKSAGFYSRNGADGWVIKLDAAGRKQWDRTLGGTSSDELQSIAQAADGSYLVGFSTASPVSGDKTQPSRGGYLDYWVVKLDASGQKQWDQVVGGAGLDYFVTARPTTDGGYILGGHTDSGISGDKTQPSRGGYDYWVVKLDANGQKQWDQRVGSSVGDTLGDLRQTRDGGYLLGGMTKGNISGDKTQARRGARDYWVVKLDATGSYQWDATFGGNSEEQLASLQQLADGNFLLAGTSYSGVGADKSEVGRGYADYWLVKFTVGPQLTVVGEQILCPGSAVVLTALASPAATAYAWNTGATTTSLRVTQAGTYSVVATFADGQTRTAQQQVVAFATSLAITGDSVLCPGQSLTLAATTGASTYVWSTGATTPTLAVSQPGLYAVVATYPGGCTARAQLRVRAQAPLLPFSLGVDTTLCDGALLVLRAPSISGAAYRWSDGSTGTTLAVQQAGTYSLTLTSCTSQIATRHVAVKPCVVIPNAITPNGDGQNDRFRVQGLTGADWQLLVHDRWGRLVYQSADYHHDWGEQAAPGVYYYYLRQAATNAAYKGWVEVLR